MEEIINILCWKWEAKGYPHKYTAQHVNTLASMLAKNITIPYKLTCITDNTEGIDSSINVFPLWDFVHVKRDISKPNCYRRLYVFSDHFAFLFPKRVVSIDLDTVIVGNIDHILTRQEDFIAWSNPTSRTTYQGSLFSHKTGTRSFVYDSFDPRAVDECRHFVGSDQAWLSYKLGLGEATYTKEKDGVYSFSGDIEKQYHNTKLLPTNACLIMFHGNWKPWTSGIARSYRFIKKHYV